MKPGLVGWSCLGHVVMLPRHSPIPAPFAVVSTKHHGERQMGSRRHRTKSTIAYPASTVAAALRPVAGLRVGLGRPRAGGGSGGLGDGGVAGGIGARGSRGRGRRPHGPAIRPAPRCGPRGDPPAGAQARVAPIPAARASRARDHPESPVERVAPGHAARDGGHPHRGRGGRRRPCGGAVCHVRMPGTPGASIRTHEGAGGVRAARRSAAGSCRGDARAAHRSAAIAPDARPSDTRPLTGPQILTWIDDIVRGMGSKVPPASAATLKRIRAAARAALPADDRPLDFTDHETWLVRQAACDYLPSAISRYLAVDPAMRGRTGADRRSPDDVLLESLRAIEGYLDEAVVRANERDVVALLDYERFLKDRLARPSALQIEHAEGSGRARGSTRSRARVAALRDERLAAGHPRGRQEAPGRRGRDGLAGSRSLGHVGGRRDREARWPTRRGTPAWPSGPAWRRRSRRRATSRWSSACPGRARPTSGASRTCRRRSRSTSCPRRTWNGGSTCSARAGPPSTRSRPASPARSCPDRGAPDGPASRSSATSTSASPSSSRARSRSGRRLDAVMTPDGRKDHRLAYLAAIRAYNADGRPARTWPIQFLVRRTAHHVMDHAWELEDRDPARQDRAREPEQASSRTRPWMRPASGYSSSCGDAGLGQAERDRRGVGHEQVGMDPGPRSDAVLQQPMRHRHGRAEQVAPRPDRLADRVTPVEHGLEIEVRDGRTGRAHVVRGGDRPLAAVDERAVHRRRGRAGRDRPGRRGVPRGRPRTRRRPRA